MSVKTFSDITPDWLTAILTQHGSLTQGRVECVEQTRDPNPVTQNATLLLTYSSDARGARPDRLFFKRSGRASEAKFFREIAPSLTHTGCAELLRRAIRGCQESRPDSLRRADPLRRRRHCQPLVYHEMIVDALADLHRQFWDDPRLQPEIAALAADVPAFSHATASRHFAAFADTLGDRLSRPARRR